LAKKCAKAAANPRLGSTGGQAVMEGVMMKSKKRIALAVRRLDTKEIKNRMQLGRFYAEKQNTTLTTRY